MFLEINSFVLCDVRNNVGKRAREAFGEVQVDAFVGHVGIAFWSQNSESIDSSFGVHLLQLCQKRDCTALAIGTVVFTVVKLFACVTENFLDPGFRIFHTPALTCMATFDGHFAAIGDILRYLF